MIKIENVEIMGFEQAIRGMRNPKNSWERSDSNDCMEFRDLKCEECKAKGDEKHPCPGYIIGEKDLELMRNLKRAGTDHRKYLRMITVYLDITAPLYWWKEFDTYKVGTVANSCSTMHKIHAKRFEMSDFSCEHLLPASIEVLESIIETLNEARDLYLGFEGFKDKYRDTNYKVPEQKDIWWQMIQLLPSSYNQKRTIMLNYEVLTNMYKSRKSHKLDEWREFCKWIKELPYSELIISE